MTDPARSVLRHPLLSILMTLVIVLISFQLIGPMIGAMLAFPFFPGTIEEFQQGIVDPLGRPEFKTSLFIMQGCATLFGMVLIPMLLLRMQHRSLGSLFDGPVYAQPLFLVIVLVVVFMGVNSIVIQWNESIHLPFGVDDWARKLEEKLGEATKQLTTFSSAGDFLLAFAVIAVLPAIGEEIVFRGIIQNEFFRATRNVHVGIWMGAILFSAIHFQFFGFFPRMLLGAMFGYLYAWSGTLWVPVVAHFVNNGFTLFALYLYQRDAFPINLEDESVTAPLPAVAFSAVFSAVLLYTFKNFYNTHPKADIPA